MKNIEEFTDEVTTKIVLEVNDKIPGLVDSIIAEYELPNTGSIKEALIDMYASGLSEGIDRATQALNYYGLYEATRKMLKEDHE